MQRKPINLTVAQARNLCVYWQKRLGISDWFVRVEIKRFDKLKLPNTAEVGWSIAHRSAIVTLLDPDDDRGGEIIQHRDMEADLVHELLHITMAMFDEEDGSTRGLAQEQMMNSLSDTLVDLRRKARDHIR